MKLKKIISTCLLLSIATCTINSSNVFANGQNIQNNKFILENSLMGGFVGSTNRHYLQNDYNEVIQNNSRVYDSIGWIGDNLNSEIVLWTGNENVKNVSVEVTDFKNENGKVIEKSNVSTKFLKEVSAHVGRGFSWGNIPGSNVPREMVPDVIYSSDNMNIDKNRVQSIWVDIDIPRDAVAGIYNGQIKVNADGLTEPIVFDYNFEVLNLVQPSYEESDYHLDLWQYPYTVARYYDVEPFSTEHFEILKPQMEEYKEAGGKVITTTIVEDPWNTQTYDKYPSMVKWTKKSNGEYAFDYTHFDKWVQFNLDLGIEKQINCYSIVPWANRIIYFDEATGKDVDVRLTPGSKAWKDLWNEFLEDFTKHLDEKEWFDKVYIAMDERSMSEMKAAVELINGVKNEDGNSLKISGAMNYNQLSEGFLDQIQDISINLGHINHNDEKLKELSEHRRKLGLNTTMYTCVGDYPSSFTRSSPVESAWTIWYAASQNTDGFLRWAFDAWVENPLESVDHWYWESGDPFYVYPGNKENPEPRTSPRFEKLKEGIKDIEKLNYIKENVPAYADDIDSLLGSLQRAYGKTNAWGAMESGSKQNDTLIATEVERMKNGLMDISKEISENIGVKPVIKTLSGKNVNQKSLDLTWNIDNKNIKEFIIYKDGKEISRVAGNENSYTINNLKNNTLYGFKVVAVSVDGISSSAKSLNIRTNK